MSSAPPPYPPQHPQDEPPPYEPFQSYYQPQQPQRRQVAPGSGRGLLGGLAAAGLAVAKYGAFLLSFAPFKTLLTLMISFGAYALILGPWFAAGLVLMILVHEMGHVIEIRRQGMQASAPLFIPFFGAAIFQRSHPTDALKQAQIGIAGPLAGTVGATVAFVLYGTTHSTVILSWAYIGFFINLFNLIPVGMLDGGWILAVVSKWFQIFGLIVLVLAVFILHLNPIVLIIVLMGLPAVFERFRNDQNPYYQSVPVTARYAMGAAWLMLTIYLGFAMLQTHELLQTIVR
jgi:Zn-dependent protease